MQDYLVVGTIIAQSRVVVKYLLSMTISNALQTICEMIKQIIAAVQLPDLYLCLHSPWPQTIDKRGRVYCECSLGVFESVILLNTGMQSYRHCASVQPV